MPDADAQGMWVYLIHACIAGSCQRLRNSRIYVWFRVAVQEALLVFALVLILKLPPV